MIDRNQIVAIAGMVFFGAAAIYMFQLSGINDVFLASVLSRTIDISMTQAPLLNMPYLIAGIFVLALSFAFIGIYALVEQKMDWILIVAGAAMIPISLLLIGISLTGAFFGAGLLIAVILLQYCPIDDAKAYKELRPGRIVRGAAGTSMLALSVLVALAVYLTVSGDASYSEKGVNSIVDTMIKMTMNEATLASVNEVEGGMDMLKNEMQNSEVVAMIKSNYAAFSAITAFATIQVIGIIVAPVAGLFAWIMWKLNYDAKTGA